MNKNGPIVVIEDDADDREILEEIFKDLDYQNQVIYFADSEKALVYLVETRIKPFLILSDINMPRLSGLELRQKIHTNEDLNLKCIPYLFFTTTVNQKEVVDAYSKSVQGFFVKPATIEKLKSTIKKIIEYWHECEAPNFIPG
ncbi:MAG TPA: response regulator [Chitinophagaceae bacterium]|nr:response regulator [Chitinophagaceae bacterium]